MWSQSPLTPWTPRRGRRSHRVAELRLADSDHVAVLEPRAAHATLIDEHAVGAAQILDESGSEAGDQHGMMTADRPHCERKVVVTIAADRRPPAQHHAVVLAVVDPCQDAYLSLGGRAL